MGASECDRGESVPVGDVEGTRARNARCREQHRTDGESRDCHPPLASQGPQSLKTGGRKVPSRVIRRRVTAIIDLMDPLSGPVVVSANLQIRIPKRLAAQLRLGAGDALYFRVSEDNPGVIELVPTEVVERRYSVGERRERAAQTHAKELPDSGLPDRRKR